MSRYKRENLIKNLKNQYDNNFINELVYSSLERVGKLEYYNSFLNGNFDNEIDRDKINKDFGMNYDKTQEKRTAYDKFCSLSVGWLVETLLFKYLFPLFSKVDLKYNGQEMDRKHSFSSKADFVDKEKNVSIEVTSYNDFNSKWFPFRKPKFMHILRERICSF